MADTSPSRSAILELRDERQSMVEGHAFLDEKCLAIAAEIVRELARHQALEAPFLERSREAAQALQAAVYRHGLEELGTLPAPAADAAPLALEPGTLMGVKLLRAKLSAPPEAIEPPPWGSPEGTACREAFERLLALAPEIGAAAGNLERLSEEYRRSIRRARALDDVLIPEAGRELAAMETALEDLEREDAIAMRLGAGRRRAERSG